MPLIILYRPLFLAVLAQLALALAAGLLGWARGGLPAAETHALATALACCPWAWYWTYRRPQQLAHARGLPVLPPRVQAALVQADTLLLHKTGCLTEGAPKLTMVQPVEGQSETNLLRLAASLVQQSDHPLAQAMVQAAHTRQIGLLPPFALKPAEGRGVSGIVDGRSVAVGSAALLESLHIPVSLKTKAEPYKSQGQTVLFVARDGHCVGLLMFTDALRPNLREAMAQLKQSGLNPVLLTGESPTCANTIARKLEIECIEADATPARKQERIAQLQAAGRKLALMGDWPPLSGVLRVSPQGDIPADFTGLAHTRKLAATMQHNRQFVQQLLFAYHGIIWCVLQFHPDVPLALAANAAASAASYSWLGRLNKLPL